MNSARGFTLLELIGVVAVIAILSSVLAPGVVQTINRSYAAAEDENLAVLASTLRTVVQTTRTVPGPAINTWTTALAAQSEFTAQQIRFNRRNQQRTLLVDPLFFTSAEAPFGGYVQTSGLFQRPFSPRLMLLSNMAGAVPAVPNTAAGFDAVWNQTAAAAAIEGPDLKIERIHLGDLFHHVLLTNSNTAAAGYALDGAAAQAVPPAVGGTDGEVSVYVLNGTRIRYLAATFPSGAQQTSAIVRGYENRGYVTNGSAWFWSAP